MGLNALAGTGAVRAAVKGGLDAEAAHAALELFRSKPALGFSDCLMLQLARKAGHLPLGTFDRRLAKVVGTEKL